MSKKILAVVLSLILAFSVVAVPVGAADIEFTTAATSVENVFNVVLDKIISFVLKYLNMYWPGYEGSWDTAEDYETPEIFFEGDKDFDKSVTAESQWKLGYASASLLDGIDPMNGEFYLAGSLEPIKGRVPSKVLDDQRVRVYAISDSTGGIVVQAVVDGFGLSRGDVMTIRERLVDFAEERNIVAINVSVLHQHSLIDTLGMNVPLAQALIFNTGNAASGGLIEGQKVQKNQKFMENLFNKTVFAIKKAVVNMKEGDLYYGSVDISDYMRDKRDPQAMDTNLHRLRFAPSDGSAETWILEAGVHLMSFGAGGDILSGDFPYYIEKTLREEKNVNMVYVQGAELAISMREVALCIKCHKSADIPVVTKPASADDVYTISCPKCGYTTEPSDAEGSEYTTEDAKDYAKTVDAWNRVNGEGKVDTSADEYGYTIAQKVISIGSNEKALDPVLNIAMKEVSLKVTNEILTLAAREDVLNAIIVKDGAGYKLITEIGYMELGNEVAVFLCPGEFDPMLVYGGPESGDAAWTGGKWTKEPLKEATSCDTVLAFGLCNDQAGYVLRDNEYHSLLSENEEVNVISTTAGSTFVNAFESLLKEIGA